MQAACVMRRTFDPRELASLGIADNRIVADRMQLVKNEGDVRGIQLVRSSGLPFQVLTVGPLDNVTRVHLFVYGAAEVWELGEELAYLLPETAVARMIAAEIRTLDDVEVLSLAPVEQDSGRDMLPGLVAARLGWELFSNVLSLSVKDHRARLTQITDDGTQEIDAALPICVSADDACPLGNDPSDEYDLIEKLEKRASRKTTAAALGVAIGDGNAPELSSPPERQARPIVKLAPEAVAAVADMLRRFQG